ncbi:MAG: hypothetical protein JWR75_645 [Devosia sp.]|nr:hypothetical protein [Devosia sp.]
MRDDDTIVALSSGGLPSGIAVIRLSGPGALSVLETFCGGVPEPRRLALRAFVVDGETIDTGLIAAFPAPNSFTGEDCSELQMHGSTAVVRKILRTLTTLPRFRLAIAGEFTRRAFENGRLDLTEIEGLGDLLEAETESQRRLAVSRLDGHLSRQIARWREALLDLRAEIEARIDFSDEGDVGELPASFANGVADLRADLETALQGFDRGRQTREGIRVALAGLPNAGKSSLINALSHSDVAIVTDEPGTTRDIREVALDLDGHKLILIDMAGLRETSSVAEAEGVRRAEKEIARADLVLWLEAPGPRSDPPESDGPIWRISTKADLMNKIADDSISTVTGAGIATLLKKLASYAAETTKSTEPLLISHQRDYQALTDARHWLTDVPHHHLELAAESLRLASATLERLVGSIDAERVLDRLFSAFCIGK